MTGVRSVTSNQDDIYKNLEQVVRKYATTRFLRPIADHTREAFEQAKEFINSYYEKREPNISTPHCVVIDSGCGAGESTLHLARKFSNVPVIGIDKSALRLNKAGNIHQQEAAGTDQPANAFWIRAELLDFWRLALEEVQAGRWHILHHAVYYPNPWPKESEATRRFHLHPIFPTMITLGDVTELRTNWEIYAREFAEAARILTEVTSATNATIGHSSADISCTAFAPDHPETAFERKYKEARQQLWRVIVNR